MCQGPIVAVLGFISKTLSIEKAVELIVAIGRIARQKSLTCIEKSGLSISWADNIVPT